MKLLFREDAYLQSCEAEVLSATPEGIRLGRTVFYPEGGGQPGDSGWLELPEGGRIEIVDTLKGPGPDEVLHIPAADSPPPAAGTKVTARIDWQRRYRLMRMHSCLHLLCGLVEGDVTGGQIGDGKGRLDFNLTETPNKAVLQSELNRLITEDRAVATRWIEEAELDAQPQLVRTLSVKPPRGSGRVRLLEIEGVNLQPCGGTHVRSTGEIGAVEIGKIENKGKQNRRINLRFAS